MKAFYIYLSKYNIFIFVYHVNKRNVSITANEGIASIQVFDGNEYINMENGMELEYGAYELVITSNKGVTYRETITITPPTPSTSNNVWLVIFLFILSLICIIPLSTLVIRKYKKKVLVS